MIGAVRGSGDTLLIRQLEALSFRDTTAAVSRTISPSTSPESKTDTAPSRFLADQDLYLFNEGGIIAPTTSWARI